MDNKLFGIDVSRSIEAVQDEPAVDDTLKKKRRGKVYSAALDDEKEDVSEDAFESETTEEPSRGSDERISSREVDIIDVEQSSVQHSDRTR
jgi:hypothetical protein